MQTPSVGGSAYYALQVEASIPPAVKPYDQVKQQVLADWNADQLRRAANEAATKMLVALKGGQSISDAAAVAGVPVQPHAAGDARGRAAGNAGAAGPRVVRPEEGSSRRWWRPTIRSSSPSPAEIDDPDPAADPGGYAVVRQALSRSLGNDFTTLFADAVRERANPKINQANYDSVVQPQQQ